MDCSLPGFSVHGLFQARVLEWVVISFSMGSSWPRDQTQVSCIAGRRFTLWATREAKVKIIGRQYRSFLLLQGLFCFGHDSLLNGQERCPPKHDPGILIPENVNAVYSKEKIKIKTSNRLRITQSKAVGAHKIHQVALLQTPSAVSKY